MLIVPDLPAFFNISREMCIRDRVVCVEIDSRLLPILDETLGEFDNIRIVNDDVLKVDLHRLIE